MTSALHWFLLATGCMLVFFGGLVYAWITRDMARPLSEQDQRLSAVDVELDDEAARQAAADREWCRSVGVIL